MGSLGEKGLLLDAQQPSSGLWSRSGGAVFALCRAMWGGRAGEARGGRSVALREKRNVSVVPEGLQPEGVLPGPTREVTADAPIEHPVGSGASLAPERH